MSFVLTDAATEFMELMNRVFRNYLDEFMIVFIDDIFVYSKSDGYQMGHLRVVLQVLMEHQLVAEYSKCDFD